MNGLLWGTTAASLISLHMPPHVPPSFPLHRHAGLNPGLIRTGIRQNYMGAGRLAGLVEWLIGKLCVSPEVRAAQRSAAGWCGGWGRWCCSRRLQRLPWSTACAGTARTTPWA